MKCLKCGMEIKKSDIVCIHCGHSISTIGNDNTKKTNKNSQEQIANKDKFLEYTIILAFLFGIYGIHNFYLGYYKKGVYQLLLTLVLPYITIIWVLFDIILILNGTNTEDATGNKIKMLKNKL